ncbi:MAG: transposase [Armatimonadota bacterium]
MHAEYASLCAEGKPAARAISAQLRQQLREFVAPLLAELAPRLDARLLRTFTHLLEVIVSFRHRQHGLRLSELGGYLLTAEHAPAGTKRLSNLLRSPHWTHALLSRFLWRQADRRVQELSATGAEAVLLWDESVLEKPESLHSEGLGSVRSSKAARLKRIKPGFFNPPGGRPVHVPGMAWLCLLVLGHSGPPTVALMRWWSNRASGRVPRKEPRQVRQAVLRWCARQWGRRVLHLWDRGYAGSPWLGLALTHQVRCVLRWPKRWKLRDATGADRPAWQLTRGKRSWGTRYLRDPRRKELQKVGVVAVRLTHPDYAAPLWLVVARSQHRPEPWYLLTNEPIETVEAAWQVVLAYARRWQVEMAFRYGKSELAMESPRLWRWDRRLNLLLVVTLVYAFLLSLLDERLELLRKWLLRHYCHRTGKRSRETPAPLYRLRAALSRLWLDFPDPRPLYGTNPG